MSDTLHLACAADRAYVPHVAAMLHSVIAQRGDLEVQVYFLHGPALPRRTLRRLAAMVERLGASIRPLEIADERVGGLPTSVETTEAMWYRIYLPELLPEVPRVLYLDGDALAVDSLEPLWATDLGDHLVAAVTNVFIQDPVARALPAALGLSAIQDYFNSGVLLMNLDQMRREGSTAEVREVARSKKFFWGDQDFLNAVMARRRLALHPRWNLMNSIATFDHATEAFTPEEVEEARQRPGIRHFEGPERNKPWHVDCDFPLRELYFEHRRATPWPHVERVGGPPEPRHLARLRRLKRALRP